MNLKRLVPLTLLAVLIVPLASAQAYWRVGIGIGVPVYHRPYYRVYVGVPPIYVGPAPVYVQPVPVYVQPAPVYVQPAPVVQPAQPAPAPAPAPAPVAPTAAPSSALPLTPVPAR